MPKYLPLSAIRSMEYSELERWWEADFDSLVSTAVAEATGEVRSSVASALASEEWIEHWADALFTATSDLSTSVERMEYTGDLRLQKTRARCGKVMLRMQDVNRLRKQHLREQGRAMAPLAHTDGRAAVLSILGRHHGDELRSLRAAELNRQGLPHDGPLYGTSYPDGLASVEDAVARGILTTPITPEVHRLMNGPRDDLRKAVARDATQQEEREDALRHPLVLRQWAECLRELMDEHSQRSGIKPSFATVLPGLDMNELWRMPQEEAWRCLNRRRFLRALVQRNRECEMHQRQLMREVSKRADEMKRPWLDAAHTAREEVARRHPEEFQALLKAIHPYLEEGSTRFKQQVMTGRPRKALVDLLKEKLVNGTLLDA